MRPKKNWSQLWSKTVFLCKFQNIIFFIYILLTDELSRIRILFFSLLSFRSIFGNKEKTKRVALREPMKRGTDGKSSGLLPNGKKPLIIDGSEWKLKHLDDMCFKTKHFNEFASQIRWIYQYLEVIKKKIRWSQPSCKNACSMIGSPAQPIRALAAIG